MYHNNKIKLYSLRASIEKHFDEFTDLVREAKEDELKRKLIKKIRRKKERVHFFFFFFPVDDLSSVFSPFFLFAIHGKMAYVMGAVCFSLSTVDE